MSDNPTVIQESNPYDNVLKIQIQNSPVCVVNAIRRTILADIPCYVFNGFPVSENNITIHKNTCRLNNEIIKQRISCIPVHLTDFTLPYESIEFTINVSNTTNSMLLVTTDDFQVNAVQSNMDDETTTVTPDIVEQFNPKVLFPHDPITKSPIVITRLKPKINEKLPGEVLHLTAKLSISSAKHNGCYNVSSTCSFSNTVDETNATIAWDNLASTMNFESPEDESAFRENWMLLEGKRHFKPNQFNFILEAIGIYDNKTLLQIACKVLVEKLNIVQQLDDISIKDSHSTIENAKDILMKSDYSIGKMLEHYIHENFQKDITYVSFFKAHPHDEDSILRIALKSDAETSIETIVTNTSNTIVETLDKLSKAF